MNYIYQNQTLKHDSTFSYWLNQHGSGVFLDTLLVSLH